MRVLSDRNITSALRRIERFRIDKRVPALNRLESDCAHAGKSLEPWAKRRAAIKRSAYPADLLQEYHALRREAADRFAARDYVDAQIALNVAQQYYLTLPRDLQRMVADGDKAVLGYTLDDFRNAPSGKGPLAAEWADKPHRLIYDLCHRLELAAQEQSAPVA
jgi:hypothetical protein